MRCLSSCPSPGKEEKYAHRIRGEIVCQAGRLPGSHPPRDVGGFRQCVASAHRRRGRTALFGATNAAQVHQLLGLKGQPLYKKINALIPLRWKKLLQQVCFQKVSAQLEVLETQSPAIWSRACAVIALDDTLVRRLGKKLGLVWKWWEGMSHKVARGQNVIIGDIASKQGRIKLTKPVLAERMLLGRPNGSGLDFLPSKSSWWRTVGIPAKSFWPCAGSWSLKPSSRARVPTASQSRGEGQGRNSP